MSVFEVLLPNVPKSSLLPFSGVICVFVNNALTSINPSIRKSALLMMQVLLRIAPELFEDQKMKILASLIKLTTEVKVMNTPVRGVLSTNRNTMKTNTSQQRPLSDLALETIQLFFETSFGQTSIYHRIDDWSGFSHARSAEPLLLSPSRRLCIPLSRSLYSPSLFLHTETTKPVDALETTTAAFQPLLAFLHAGMAELLPHDDAALGGHLSRHLTDSRSKSIDERSLQRLLPLQELAASLLALLHGQLGKGAGRVAAAAPGLLPAEGGRRPAERGGGEEAAAAGEHADAPAERDAGRGTGVEDGGGASATEDGDGKGRGRGDGNGRAGDGVASLAL